MYGNLLDGILFIGIMIGLVIAGIFLADSLALASN